MATNEPERSSLYLPVTQERGDEVARDVSPKPVHWDTMSHISPRVLIGLVFIGLFLTAGGIYYLSTQRHASQGNPSAAQQPSITPSQPQELTIAGSPVPTIPPPLNKVQFPSGTILYPNDWPAELRLPNTFTLLQADVGLLPDGSSQGWTATLRFKGDRRSATKYLTDFFQARNWHVQQRDPDATTTMLGVDRNNEQSSGILILDDDPGNPGSVRILLVVRL